jgi:pyruvate/2-oxoglutarate dehydrogenase complex dihydrolipoamide dehydrogenase (E3) component
VLGGGPAGVFAARATAGRGVRTALVLPTAAVAEPPDLSPFGEEIRRLQARFGLLGPSEPAGEPMIDVYRGQPRFLDRHTLAVDQHQLRFRKAVIATGGVDAPPEIDGAEEAGCLRAEQLAELRAPPPRLAVVGGGKSGCLWAQAISRLGSHVHLISAWAATSI